MNKIIFTGLILIVAGCAVGPKYSRPNTKKPEAYAQSAVRTDSITNLKWWDVYQDTVLQSLIKKANRSKPGFEGRHRPDGTVQGDTRL
jgi:multidrug efflux system outer membrane protein